MHPGGTKETSDASLGLNPKPQESNKAGLQAVCADMRVFLFKACQRIDRPD